MVRLVDAGLARDLLERSFSQASSNDPPISAISPSVEEALAKLFSSGTQAYREALVGCCLARIIVPDVDVRYPYVHQAETAFSGRTLDERVVNPFLRTQQIPSSKSPYLSALRRGVNFAAPEAAGQSDKGAFRALHEIVSYIAVAPNDEVEAVLVLTLRQFIALRDRSRVPLARVRRLSLDQHLALASMLLKLKSGGRVPVFLCVAALRATSGRYALGWTVDFQGINVADAATGAGGDVTVSKSGDPVVSIEITEREIDEHRVASTFASKIATNSIEDYLFVHSAASPTLAARKLARDYFAQGHDVNFVSISEWLGGVLILLGATGRSQFTHEIVLLLDERDVPSSLKVSWNDCVGKLISTAT
jgi:SacI restriction endonuclease